MERDKQESQIVIYKTQDGQTKLDVRFESETVWLAQADLAELFQTTKQNISQHVSNIFEEGELAKNGTVKNFLTVKKEGSREVSRDIEYYNLDLIISVGYRVKSGIATAFRQWATAHLREYIVKGFVVDDERLKNPDLPFDYFEELSRRISEIRTSEKRFYKKITDIYSTSVDYDPADIQSVLFFKTVQNKVHWAITGKTAAEIVSSRVDSNKPNMGLTNWRGKKPVKTEVSVAKNYLDKDELEALNNLVEQYLIFAEGQALRRTPMYMKDWIAKLHGFLILNDRDILDNAGKVSHELAKEIAEKEYDVFVKKTLIEQSAVDDFDEFVGKIDKLTSKDIKKSKKL